MIKRINQVKRSHQVGTIEFTVERIPTKETREIALVYEQKINPKTGKGWQKRRNYQRFEGPKAFLKADFELLRRANAAKKKLRVEMQQNLEASAKQLVSNHPGRFPYLEHDVKALEDGNPDMTDVARIRLEKLFGGNT